MTYDFHVYPSVNVHGSGILESAELTLCHQKLIVGDREADSFGEPTVSPRVFAIHQKIADAIEMTWPEVPSRENGAEGMFYGSIRFQLHFLNFIMALATEESGKKLTEVQRYLRTEKFDLFEFNTLLHKVVGHGIFSEDMPPEILTTHEFFKVAFKAIASRGTISEICQLVGITDTCFIRSDSLTHNDVKEVIHKGHGIAYHLEHFVNRTKNPKSLESVLVTYLIQLRHFFIDKFISNMREPEMAPKSIFHDNMWMNIVAKNNQVEVMDVIALYLGRGKMASDRTSITVHIANDLFGKDSEAIDLFLKHIWQGTSSGRGSYVFDRVVTPGDTCLTKRTEGNSTYAFDVKTNMFKYKGTPSARETIDSDTLQTVIIPAPIKVWPIEISINPDNTEKPGVDIYIDTFPLISKLFRKVIDLY